MSLLDGGEPENTVTTRAKGLTFQANGPQGLSRMKISDEGQTEAGTDRRGGSVLGWVVPLLAAYVRAQGHDSTPILELTGIRGRDLKDPDVRVPESASREAWRLAMTMTPA